MYRYDMLVFSGGAALVGAAHAAVHTLQQARGVSLWCFGCVGTLASRRESWKEADNCVFCDALFHRGGLDLSLLPFLFVFGCWCLFPLVAVSAFSFSVGVIFFYRSFIFGNWNPSSMFHGFCFAGRGLVCRGLVRVTTELAPTFWGANHLELVGVVFFWRSKRV